MFAKNAFRGLTLTTLLPALILPSTCLGRTGFLANVIWGCQCMTPPVASDCRTKCYTPCHQRGSIQSLEQWALAFLARLTLGRLLFPLLESFMRELGSLILPRWDVHRKEGDLRQGPLGISTNPECHCLRQLSLILRSVETTECRARELLRQIQFFFLRSCIP